MILLTFGHWWLIELTVAVLAGAGAGTAAESELVVRGSCFVNPFVPTAVARLTVAAPIISPVHW